MLLENLICDLEKEYLSFIRRTPSLSNILNYVSIQENHHTNYLAAILRAKKSFMRSFLNIVFENEFNDFPDNIETQLKCIDALLKSKNKAIIIENKICGAKDQKKQIQNYIGGQEGCYSLDNIYVIYLTLTGGAPSQSSLPDETKEKLGSRYKEINYLNDILPWLKNDVLPECHYKEQSLIFSIELYIDYLHRMLGINENITELARKLKSILGKENIFEYEDVKALFTKIDNKITDKDRQKTLHQIINIVLREMERENIYLNENTVAYNLKWLLKNNPTPMFKESCNHTSYKPFTSIGQFTYYGHKYVQLAALLANNQFCIHLCCTVDGIKAGPYLLANKEAISGVWNFETLLQHGFIDKGNNFSYPFNSFTEKLPLTDVAKHIKDMIEILNNAMLKQ